MFQRESQHLAGWTAILQGQRLAGVRRTGPGQGIEVGVRDMAAVFAQMGGID